MARSSPCTVRHLQGRHNCLGVHRRKLRPTRSHGAPTGVGKVSLAEVIALLFLQTEFILYFNLPGLLRML